MKYLITAFTFLLLAAMSCKKNKDSEKDKLPPVTQTGANTFGCLVNGKVYIPKGYSGTGTPNPHITFDIGLNGLAYFQIVTEQLNKNHDPEGYVIISFGNISGKGNYNFPAFNFSIGWAEVLNNCFTPAFDSTSKKFGGGVITKYDIINRIVSGTFDCKFKTQTCDTVFITNGRFDFKF